MSGGGRSCCSRATPSIHSRGTTGPFGVEGAALIRCRNYLFAIAFPDIANCRHCRFQFIAIQLPALPIQFNSRHQARGIEPLFPLFALFSCESKIVQPSTLSARCPVRSSIPPHAAQYPSARSSTCSVCSSMLLSMLQYVQGSGCEEPRIKLTRAPPQVSSHPVLRVRYGLRSWI
jgi:hypothetical protein